MQYVRHTCLVWAETKLLHIMIIITQISQLHCTLINLDRGRDEAGDVRQAKPYLDEGKCLAILERSSLLVT